MIIKQKIKYCYNKHINSKKHKKNIIIKEQLFIENEKNFICNNCYKQLKSKQNLEKNKLCCRCVSSLLECCKCNKIFNKNISRYKHEQKCKIESVESIEKIKNLDEDNNILVDEFENKIILLEENEILEEINKENNNIII